jgi:Tol biopolymer transport system component
MTAARFSADGETIVYSAGWEGRPQELYTTRVGAVGERALGINGALLAISTAGEIALLKDVRILANWMEVGTLARAPLAGGAPREILRDIGGADWSPDGRSLAVTRFLPDVRRWQLEYPVGTVVYTTDRWIERPRIARDETRFLLLEHPISGDNRGRVIQVTRDGKKTDLTAEYPSVIGLAWAPEGNEAWFTASLGGVRLQLLAARANAPIRHVMPGPASLVVEDVLPSGRLLVQTVSTKVRMLVKTPRDDKERDISWFDYGLLRDMSPDGSTLLFEEEGEGGGPNYSVFIRHTDGSPAVRLGDGYAGRLSPDLQWATTSSPLEASNVLTIVPVGPGEPRKLTIPLRAQGFVNWFPDGKRLIVVGNEPGRPRRTYEFVIDTGKVRSLTPDGTTGTLISPDGRSLAVTTPDGKQLIWPLDGGDPRDIPGVTPQEIVLRWASDGRSVFVATASSPTTRTISRIELATGRRQMLMTIAPSDAAGVRNTSIPLISADGATYAYRYGQVLSDLFVADGVR